MEEVPVPSPKMGASLVITPYPRMEMMETVAFTATVPWKLSQPAGGWKLAGRGQVAHMDTCGLVIVVSVAHHDL